MRRNHLFITAPPNYLLGYRILFLSLEFLFYMTVVQLIIARTGTRNKFVTHNDEHG